jgi:hypothetical protein
LKRTAALKQPDISHLMSLSFEKEQLEPCYPLIARYFPEASSNL